MFLSSRKKRVAKLVAESRAYLSETYEPPISAPVSEAESGIRYSLGSSYSISEEDVFDEAFASLMISDTLQTGAYDRLRPLLASTRKQTFVDKVNWYIQKRELRVTSIYRAAQMDRRLFSKVMSDRDYSPSKDTVLAIAFALHLSVDEAKDLLERAGYSLSHSSERDIVIEYFFRSCVYDLDDINDALSEIGMKRIGR